jgi:hypothetical protein
LRETRETPPFITLEMVGQEKLRRVPLRPEVAAAAGLRKLQWGAF